jgi:hypothetical protein
LKDNYIVILLAGMLVYKFLDMWVNQLKISQSLLRYDRLTSPLLGTESPRRALYRAVRKKCQSKSLARSLILRHGIVSRASFGFADLVMLSLLLVVAKVLGGVQLIDHRTHGSYIVGTATIAISIITSSVAVAMESLREAIERV